jgi:hypothetical protein
MSVELFPQTDPYYYIPGSLRDEYWNFDHDKQRLDAEWNEQVYRAQQAALQPVKEWEFQIREWEKRFSAPQEWSPRHPHPGPKPDPAPQTPILPQKPVLEPSARLRKAIEKAAVHLKQVEDLATTFREWLEKWVQGLSRDLEKIGYEEIEYRRSDEAILDLFQGNDWRFDEEGERVR